MKNWKNIRKWIACCMTGVLISALVAPLSTAQEIAEEEILLAEDLMTEDAEEYDAALVISDSALLPEDMTEADLMLIDGQGAAEDLLIEDEWADPEDEGELIADMDPGTDVQTDMQADPDDMAEVDSALSDDFPEAVDVSEEEAAERDSLSELSETESEAEEEKVLLHAEEPFTENAGEDKDPFANGPVTGSTGARRYQWTTAPTDSEALFEEYAKKVLYGEEAVSSGTGRRKLMAVRLTGVNAMVYQALTKQIEEVAAGTRASTEFEVTVEEMGLADRHWTAAELGVSELADENGVTAEAIEAMNANLYDLNRVLSALLVNLPYELYWFDKTEGIWDTGVPVYADYDMEKEEEFIAFSGSATFGFTVAAEYALDECTVNTRFGTTVTKARETACQIVSEYEGANDYQKLKGYKNEICELTDYNFTAVNENWKYGNPWQLIWVFDQDPSTKVVCEGYSKAFQYLCDLTTFTGSISCMTVTGIMYGGTGAGGHMWNIVAMEDGLNYLVDVTNCEGENGEYDDSLFLVGYTSGNINARYVFELEWGSLGYGYDDDTRDLYTEAELAIASSSYVWQENNTCVHQPVTDLPVEATCTENGLTEGSHCRFCGEVLVPQQIVWATGHQIEETPGIEADCTQEGMTAGRICTVCGEILAVQETVPALGHDWGDWQDAPEGTPEEEGACVRVCQRCGEEEICTHEETETLPAIPPACTVPGVTEGEYCLHCDKELTEQQVLEPLGHEIELIPAKAAGCTTKGSTAGKRCRRCKEMLESPKSIAAKGHKWSAWTTTKLPTVFAAGSKKRTCSACGKTETAAIAKLAAKLTLGRTTATIAKTKSLTITCSINRGDSLTLIRSSNTGIATAAYKAGKLTIKAQKKPGTAWITVKTKSNLKKVVKVTVPKVATTKVTCKAVTVTKGKTVTLKPVITPSYSDSKLTFTSANKGIVTVTTKGVVKGIRRGTTVITVKSGTKSVKVNVTVK